MHRQAGSPDLGTIEPDCLGVNEVLVNGGREGDELIRPEFVSDIEFCPQ